MGEKEILTSSIQSIKEYLSEEENSSIKTGLYIALNTIRNRIIATNEELLKELGLEEETEKYL